MNIPLLGNRLTFLSSRFSNLLLSRCYAVKGIENRTFQWILFEMKFFWIFENELQQKRLVVVVRRKLEKPDQLWKKLNFQWNEIHTDWWTIVVAVIFIRKVKMLRYLFPFWFSITECSIASLKFPRIVWPPHWFHRFLILAKTRVWVSRLAMDDSHWTKKAARRHGSEYQRILASCSKNGSKSTQSIGKNEKTTFILKKKIVQNWSFRFFLWSPQQKPRLKELTE